MFSSRPLAVSPDSGHVDCSIEEQLSLLKFEQMEWIMIGALWGSHSLQMEWIMFGSESDIFTPVISQR
ncbi:hypothetical protein V6N13_132582 [Hibiscus sabdariffa]